MVHSSEGKRQFVNAVDNLTMDVYDETLCGEARNIDCCKAC